MSKITHRLHSLWESHELHMEVGIIGVAMTLLFLMVTLPMRTDTSVGASYTGPQDAVREEVDPSPSEKEPSAQGSFTTTSHEDDLRAELTQEITKVTHEISVIQKTALSITGVIQKECGGQTNACAQRLQGSLEEQATAYDKAQERLRTLTASLGNLD